MPRFGEKQRLEKFGRAVASLRTTGTPLTKHTIAKHAGIAFQTAEKLMIAQGIISESTTREKPEKPKPEKPEPRSASLIVREARRIKRILEAYGSRPE